MMNEFIKNKLIAERVLFESTDENASYGPDVKMFCANLVQIGEDAAEIAEILGLDTSVIIAWHHQYVRQADFPLRPDEMTFYRDKNKLIADARTRGAITKMCLEDELSIEDAAEMVGVSKSTIKKWTIDYARDYNEMITLKPGRTIQLKAAYAIGLEAKSILQEEIYEHDRIEGQHAAQHRVSYFEER